ncbi:hypothetical protein [Mycobacterium sp.]|uniref:hypothetical protein n=1 Tax=Mycobacterium sp. TaxID=1785 RepID=UPI003F948638
MGKLRVSADDVRATAAYYQASAGRLTGDTSTGAGQSFQPSAAAVQAVHAGTAMTRAALSARTAATGMRVAEADARYLQNEAESAVKLQLVGLQGV